MATGFSIKEGMGVQSSDGQYLGKVIGIFADGIQVEGGTFFPKGHRLLNSDIKDIDDDRILLFRDLAWLRGRGEPAYGKDYAKAGAMDEVTAVPLMEEQLEIRRKAVDRGEVAIHKKVETETKTVDVPLRKETVHVERLSSTDIKPDASYHAFVDQTFRVPLKGEEAELLKKAVYTGEVRIHKTASEEPQHFSAKLQHEEVDLMGSGSLEGDAADEIRRDTLSEDSSRAAVKEPEKG